jgi:hypothetical protein
VDAGGRAAAPPRVLQITTPMITATTTAMTIASALDASDPSGSPATADIIAASSAHL